MTNEWYGVRCLFDHGPSEAVEEARVYEEQVVLVRAGSFDGAIQKAEREADEYARVLDDVEYLGLAQAYVLADDPTEEGGEVFSLMRSSALGSDDYLARFFNTGFEHQQTTGDDSA